MHRLGYSAISKTLPAIVSQVSWNPQNRAHAAPHPNVEAAFFGNGGGQLADHHGGGQAPQAVEYITRINKVAGVPCLLDDVFQAIGASATMKYVAAIHGYDGNF